MINKNRIWKKNLIRINSSYLKCLIIFMLVLFFNGCRESEKSYLSESRTGNKLRTLRHAKVYSNNGNVTLTAFKAIRFMKEEQNSLFKDIKIYRLSCPDFVFGKDYDEYFNNLNYQDGECIFQGEIELLLDAKFKFIDKTAETGSTYAYWIASSEGAPVGPLPVKVREQEVWWSYEKVVEEIEKLKIAYPEYVTVKKIGKSVKRKPLYGLKVGQGKKTIALIGAIHAGESGPELIIPVLEKLLNQAPEIFEKITIAAIPSVNCDSRNDLTFGNPWYLRRNANKVDLNRNFPANWDQIDQTYGYETSDPDAQTYRGPYANSEPETIATIDFLKNNKPLVVFSFHCLASIAGESLGISKNGMENKTYVEQCLKYANLYWEGTETATAKPAELLSICTSGSLPEWCYLELGIPAFDMEAPFDNDDLDKCVVDKTDKELLEKYQQIHYRGFLKLLQNL